MRRYCLQRLAEADETNYVNRQRFAHYLELAEDGVSHVGGPGEEAWFVQIEQEHDNFRAALTWAIHADRTDEAARLALGLWRFWHRRTYQRGGLRWLLQILELSATNALSDTLRPQFFNALGVLAHRAARFDRAHLYHAEALRVWRERGDRAGVAQALFDIGWLHHDQVELEAAKRCAVEALALAESVGDPRLIASALMLGALADLESFVLHGAPTYSESGLSQSVIPAVERSLAIWRQLGDLDNLVTILGLAAIVYQQSGDYEGAKPLLAESVRLNVRLGNYGDRISALVGLMQQAAGTSDQVEMAHDAARILGAMRAWEETTSGRSSPWWTTEAGQAIVNKVSRRLGPEAYVRAFAEGKSLTTANFLALAERITAPRLHADPPPPVT